MPLVHRLVERLAAQAVLDRVAGPLERAARPALRRPAVQNALNGSWLGHPLHPLLIVAPIGAWMSAALLDALAGDEAADAARLLVLAGNTAAVPTAAAGIAQWVDTAGPARRIGTAHALANTAGLLAHLASARARRAGSVRAGRRWSLLGLGAVGIGGYLGGHLSYVLGVGVDHTAFDIGPDEWTDAGVGQDEVPASGFAVARADDRQLLLSRRADGRIAAVEATCTHMGGPLADADVEDGCVRCPWHGSRFRLVDGEVLVGPATTPLPGFDVRVVDGRVQVRAPLGSTASSR